MIELDDYAKKIKNSLNISVSKALDKKKKLGQYAVIWENEKVVEILGKKDRNLINEKN